VKVSEIFYSIEGEGIEIGRPQIFIRLSKCNLRCEWCDTKYSWNDGKEMSENQIISEITKYPCRSLSITGGEPLLQKEELVELIQRLKKSGYWIQINTNGTIFDKSIFELVDLVSMDCKCPSSGMQSDLDVLRQTKYSFASRSQFKFIISDEEDYQYAKKIVKSLLEGAPNVIFQPQWGSKKFASKLAKFVLKDQLNVKVILQQQKMIWGLKRGV
jgi:7-carboxy-7-deazaguanine synthase